MHIDTLRLHSLSLLALAGLLLSGLNALAAQPAEDALLAEDALPRVERFSPQPYDSAVDAGTPAITVRFDEPMNTGGNSFTGGGETFPTTTDPVKWLDDRTAQLPVKLQPGRVYWVGVNSPSHKNFRSAAGQPAPWRVILFATADEAGNPTPLPEDLLAEARRINDAATLPVPVVLRTSPEPLRANVLASTKEITVTFNQPMLDGSWSWTGGGETFPKIGKPRYDPARTTCTLPVELQPGRVYWVGINSPSHRNFQTAARVPARRYVILFATADARGNPTPIPPEMAQRARAINAASDRLREQQVAATRPAGSPAALQAKAVQLVEHMEAGQFAAAREMFAPEMTAALSAEQLAFVWQQLGQAGGEYLGHGPPSPVTPVEGFDVVHVPVRWQRNELAMRVVFDDQARVSGLWTVPPQP